MVEHKRSAALEGALDQIASAPKDQGRLEAIVVRTDVGARQSLHHVALSADGGVAGDHWAKGCWKSLPDGRPDPDVQICIMNARVIRAIAGDIKNWPPAGDNLFVDLDLGRQNLVPGQRLSVGEAILEITSIPHNGCNKFAERFGIEATRFVNSKMGKENRLRGIYAKVVQDGTVSVADVVTKI
ncbi:MAG: MOSC domain-containing protein [Geminicoccaceae bacterium]